MERNRRDSGGDDRPDAQRCCRCTLCATALHPSPTTQHNHNPHNQQQQSRSDYEADDVEHYFNYMGCLAVEGTYDRMEEMMRSGLEPVDVLLLMAAAENDDPKVEELLGAGADVRVKDNRGRTPLELATKDKVVELLKAAEAKMAKA